MRRRGYNQKPIGGKVVGLSKPSTPHVMADSATVMLEVTETKRGGAGVIRAPIESRKKTNV